MMNANELQEISAHIAKKMVEMKITPNQRGWQMIIEEVKRLRMPCVILKSEGLERYYQAGSAELDTAMSILIRNGEKFTVEPASLIGK